LFLSLKNFYSQKSDHITSNKIANQTSTCIDINIALIIIISGNIIEQIKNPTMHPNIIEIIFTFILTPPKI
tara:strand:+ start:566 stop:778 length:213 start_codon:yes stop_codon:yes gene_type:complete